MYLFFNPRSFALQALLLLNHWAGNIALAQPLRATALDAVANGPPRIYTFYSPLLEPDAALSGMSQEAHEKLVQFWTESWKEAGWKPIVLSMADAAKHPDYEEMSYLISKTNASENDQLCFYRWLAMSAVGGGWMSDYDVFNLHDFRYEGWDLPNNGMLTIHNNLIPSLISGSSDEWMRVTKHVIEYAAQREIVTDQMALEKLFIKYPRLFAEDGTVVEHVLNVTELNPSDCNEYTPISKRAVHFGYNSIDMALEQGKLPDGWSREDRPKIAINWMKYWLDRCGDRKVFIQDPTLLDGTVSSFTSTENIATLTKESDRQQDSYVVSSSGNDQSRSNSADVQGTKDDSEERQHDYYKPATYYSQNQDSTGEETEKHTFISGAVKAIENIEKKFLDFETEHNEDKDGKQKTSPSKEPDVIEHKGKHTGSISLETETLESERNGDGVSASNYEKESPNVQISDNNFYEVGLPGASEMYYVAVDTQEDAGEKQQDVVKNQDSEINGEPESSIETQDEPRKEEKKSVVTDQSNRKTRGDYRIEMKRHFAPVDRMSASLRDRNGENHGIAPRESDAREHNEQNDEMSKHRRIASIEDQDSLLVDHKDQQIQAVDLEPIQQMRISSDAANDGQRELFSRNNLRHSSTSRNEMGDAQQMGFASAQVGIQMNSGAEKEDNYQRGLANELTA